MFHLQRQQVLRLFRRLLQPVLQLFLLPEGQARQNPGLPKVFLPLRQQARQSPSLPKVFLPLKQQALRLFRLLQQQVLRLFHFQRQQVLRLFRRLLQPVLQLFPLPEGQALQNPGLPKVFHLLRQQVLRLFPLVLWFLRKWFHFVQISWTENRNPGIQILQSRLNQNLPEKVHCWV